MSELDDRIRDALHDLDTRVANAVHQPRSVRHRPARFLLPVLAAIAVLAVLVGSVVIGRQQDKAESVVPTGRDTFSQTQEEAVRDGVYPQVAALPWKQRIGAKVLKVTNSTVGGRALTWKLVRPDLSSVTGFGKDGCLTPVDEARSYPVCQNGQYTELLAFQWGTKRIVRAYPLAEKMTWITGAAGNLYCGKDGKEPLQNSALCRVDLNTLELTGTVFDCEGEKDACGLGDKILNRYPGTWFESASIAGAASIRLKGINDLFVSAKDGRSTARLDPTTLRARSNP
jgi:hypothetical protein